MRGAKELDVRALSALGYERLENPQLLEPIKALYGSAWPLYHNHFCPSVKLVEKRRDGAQIKRTTNPRQLTSGCWKAVCSMRKSALPLSRLLLQLFVIITASFLIGRLFTRCGHT